MFLSDTSSSFDLIIAEAGCSCLLSASRAGVFVLTVAGIAPPDARYALSGTGVRAGCALDGGVGEDLADLAVGGDE